MDQGDVGVELGVVGVSRGTLIGEGGSARVYRAHQEHLDRDVAVKIITARGDEAIKRRFERERRAMGRLSSVPGILTVFDAGITEAGDLYLVMPLEDGGSLRDRIEQHGPMPWDEACRMMEQVAEAIEAAHAKNIIHRDLKPGNILVSSRGRPLVADFGIARLIADGGSVATATGFALTPAYSPPEAFESTESGPAIDVYGLGATLWALIAGRAPFTDAGGHTTLGVMISRIATQRPGDLTQVAPSEVCAVIDRAMAKDAHERQASAADFGEDLERARAGAVGFEPITGAVVAAARPSGPSDAPPPHQSVDAAPPTAAVSGHAREAAVPPTAQLPLVGSAAGIGVQATASDREPRAKAPRLQLLLVVALLLAAIGAGAAIWSAWGDDDDDDTDDVTTESDDRGDDETAGDGNDLEDPGNEATGSDGGDDAAPEAGDDAGAVAPFAIPTPTPTPDPDVLLAVRGFTDRTGAPTVPCPPTEESGFRDVATNSGVGLNVRSAPDEQSDVVLELADGYPVLVLLAGDIIDNGGGDIWVTVVLPEAEGLPEACGWVSARFISSPTSANLAEELQPPFPDVVPPGPFLSSCLPGWDAILFGTSVDGRFDVSICTDGLGGVEYHGSTTANGDDIRLVACQVSPGLYSAVNQGFEYLVTDGRGFGRDSILEVIGGDGYTSVLTGVGGTASDVGLQSC